MRTNFRHAICTSGAALLMAGGVLSPAAAQYIGDPVETRTIVREPLNLSPSQRTTVYRTIVPQGRGRQPIVRERVVTETMGSGAATRERVVVDPAGRERVVVDPAPRERVVVDQWGRERVVTDTLPRERIVTDQWGRDRVVSGPTEVDYVVGDRIPAGVQLSAFPDRVVREVPAFANYRYTIANDRVITVDPVTNTVVQVIDR
jgi:hypothetical protein